MKGPVTAVGRKISQALKGKMRKGAAGAKSIGTKLNKIPNDAMGEMQMVNTTNTKEIKPGYKLGNLTKVKSQGNKLETSSAKASRKQNALIDKQARQGFSGYTPNAKSQQNKYMADTKKFLGGK